MQTLHFSTNINAPVQKVWEVLWNDDTYRDWTRVFNEGSYAVSDWEEGSKVLFLGPDGSGMLAKIEAKRSNEFMSFKYLGIMRKGEEDTDSDEAKQWAGGLENYTLKQHGNVTELIVEGEDMDIPDNFKDFFTKVWPTALARIKALAENN